MSGPESKGCQIQRSRTSDSFIQSTTGNFPETACQRHKLFPSNSNQLRCTRPRYPPNFATLVLKSKRQFFIKLWDPIYVVLCLRIRCTKGILFKVQPKKLGLNSLLDSFKADSFATRRRAIRSAGFKFLTEIHLYCPNRMMDDDLRVEDIPKK